MGLRCTDQRCARILLKPFELWAEEIGFTCSVLLRRQGHTLLLRYSVTGPMQKLSIPAAAGREGFARGLWRTTCMECFVYSHNTAAYSEWNFSPSGAWWLCAFDNYRVPASQQPTGVRPLRMHTRQTAQCLIVQVCLPLADNAALSFAPAVILAHAGGKRSHWAIAHPFECPDFHRASSLAIPL